MILLDTNAVIWILTNHKRARAVLSLKARLVVSPVSLWELATLAELGRIAVETRIDEDERWVVDDPSSRALFAEASTVGWTRDPFDRLLVAHAAVRRFKLATGDRHIIDNVPAARLIAL